MNLRDQWLQLRNDTQGARFENRYRRRNKNRRWWRSILRLFGAALAILAGLAMLVLPGPGLLALLVGAALIAEESLFAARRLDRFELWLRRRFSKSPGV